MLTQEEARELCYRSVFERRRPTRAFVESRLAARAQRLKEKRTIEDEDWRAIWDEYLPIAGGASYFNVVLDTTGPGGASVSINGGATYATTQVVSVTLTTTDSSVTGYQIEIWGSVDTAANASIQTTQGASSWITPTWSGSGPYTATQSVTLSSGDGSKTISARIRDDVWNETSTLTASITLDTTVPTVNWTTGPDVSKVSTVSGKRTVNATFTVGSEAVTAYEVAVVSNGSSIRGSGTVIGTTNGSTGVSGGAKAAAATQAVVLDARDIQAASAGDGTKVIKVFVSDAAGNWSV
jgi:hypothetical protein